MFFFLGFVALWDPAMRGLLVRGISYSTGGTVVWIIMTKVNWAAAKGE